MSARTACDLLKYHLMDVVEDIVAVPTTVVDHLVVLVELGRMAYIISRLRLPILTSGSEPIIFMFHIQL
jgi:hypothetical protein